MIENIPQQQILTPAPQPVLSQPKPMLPIILDLIIVALVSGSGVYFWQQGEINKLRINQSQQIGYQYNQETPIKSPTTVVSTTEPTRTVPTVLPTQNKISGIDSIDNTWSLYTNNKNGFSVKVPKSVAGQEHNSCPGNYTVPTAVFDDNTGAYVTVNYFYEYPVNNICQKTTNSLNIIDQRANKWKSGQGNPLFVPSNWHIVVAKVENDTELEQFIKTSWGTSCKLGSKTKTPNGTYDVRVTGDGLDLDTTKCPINFALAFKYSPEFKKAATWAMGQDITFSSAGYKETYDEEIVNSFKFTQ